MENKKHFSLSWFFKWFIDNKVITAFVVLLLVLLNIFLLYKVNFIFKPILNFLVILSLPIILAAVFFYLLNPIVDFAERKRIPRTVTIAILFIAIISLIIWGLGIVIPGVIRAARSFIRHFPDYVIYSQNIGNNFVHRYNLTNLHLNLDNLIQKIGEQALNLVQSFYSTAIHGFGGFVTKATGIVLDIIIFPFILFYLLRDGKGLAPYFVDFLPTAWREDTLELSEKISEQLASFIRGEIIVALSAFTMLAIGLNIIELPKAMVIAVVAGLFNLIPYLGSFLAFVIALTVGIIVGPIMVLKVIIVFIIEQTIEGRFVSPLVLGSQMKIHPITILFILLTAGSAFGIWGLFLGIPVYAMFKVIIGHFYYWYRTRSPLYEEPLENHLK